MLTDKPRFPIREIVLFGFLPSVLKKWVYRLRGYRIGKGVRIGMGSVVYGGKIEIGDYVSIGFLTVIRGETIRLGSHIRIGSLTFLDTPHLEIGDGTKINEQVFVGGLQFPDSKLVIGRNCQIMQMTFINPTRSITIGDDSGIGGDCLVFGHSSWMNRFEGYPVDFRPVEIGSSVSIAWRVFILPGAKIGDGAMIGANSMVNRTIPPRCLAVGSPAEVVAKAPYFPRNVREKEKEAILREIVSEFVGYLTGHGVGCDLAGDEIDVVWRTRGWFHARERHEIIRVATIPLDGARISEFDGRTTVVVSLWEIPGSIRRQLSDRGIVWFDIERKERADLSHDLGEEVCQYLRRHGVRFSRDLRAD